MHPVEPTAPHTHTHTYTYVRRAQIDPFSHLTGRGGTAPYLVDYPETHAKLKQVYDRDPDGNTYVKIGKEVDWPATKVANFYKVGRHKRKRAEAMLENVKDLDPRTVALSTPKIRHVMDHKVNDFIKGADLVNCFLWGAGYFE